MKKNLWLVVSCLIVAAMVLVVLLLSACGGVPQEDLDAVMAEREAAEAQVAPLQSDLDATNARIASIQSDLDATSTQMASVQSDLAATESRLAETESDVVAANTQIASLQSNLAATESRLAETESDLVVIQDAIEDKSAALEILTLALSGSLPTTEVQVTRNVEYGNAGGVRLRLDMYIPETPIVTPMPAIIWIHGGSWKYGDKDLSDRADVRSLAEHGFLLVSIDYRLTRFPAQVEDSKCAVRWLRANAEKYDVDPDRIGVWGGSAGGHLAMMVGCADETATLEGDGGWAEYSSRVQAVVSYYGLSDLVSIYTEWGVVQTGSSPIAAFLGGTYQEIPEIYAAASPINYVTADDPPLLMVHGEADEVADIIESEVMYEAYLQARLEATLIRVSGAGHGMGVVPFREARASPSADEIEQMVLVFFIRQLLFL